MSSAVAAAALITGLVAGCSSSGSSGSEPLPDPGTLLQQSSQTTKSLQSAHVEIAVTGKIPGLPVKKLSGDLTNVPATAVQGTATITMGGADLDIRLVVIESTLYAALSGDSWIDFGPAADIYDPSAILNPDTGLANMLNSFADPKAEPGGKINGVETVKVTGQVSVDAVNKLVPQVKATAPVPGTAWIEQGGDHNLVQASIEPTGGNTIQMTLSDWNKSVTVTKPPV